MGAPARLGVRLPGLPMGRRLRSSIAMGVALNDLGVGQEEKVRSGVDALAENASEVAAHSPSVGNYDGKVRVYDRNFEFKY